MAIQYSYPKALSITTNDLLFGTQVSGNMGVKNVTKNFSVGSLVNLINSAVNGYRVYTAYLSQEDEENPVPTVLFNNISGSITFERVAQGVYDCIISGADNFDTAWYALTDNTFFLGSTTENYITITKTSSSTLTIRSYKSGVLGDKALSETPLEIKIFD